jgi:hypothetical protein
MDHHHAGTTFFSSIRCKTAERGPPEGEIEMMSDIQQASTRSSSDAKPLAEFLVRTWTRLVAELDDVERDIARQPGVSSPKVFALAELCHKVRTQIATLRIKLEDWQNAERTQHRESIHRFVDDYLDRTDHAEPCEPERQRLKERGIRFNVPLPEELSEPFVLPPLIRKSPLPTERTLRFDDEKCWQAEVLYDALGKAAAQSCFDLRFRVAQTGIAHLRASCGLIIYWSQRAIDLLQTATTIECDTPTAADAEEQKTRRALCSARREKWAEYERSVLYAEVQFKRRRNAAAEASQG